MERWKENMHWCYKEEAGILEVIIKPFPWNHTWYGRLRFDV